MSVQVVKGNLLEADVDYICHQVNCQGRMGSGIAKAIREKYPEAYNEYILWYKQWENYADECGGLENGPDASDLMLGHVLIHALDYDHSIIHMAAQQFYGYDGLRYTSYDAFWNCLGEIRDNIPKGRKIGFPYKIGCGLGGANWQVISAMIDAALGQDYDVYIYQLEE